MPAITHPHSDDPALFVDELREIFHSSAFFTPPTDIPIPDVSGLAYNAALTVDFTVPAGE